MDRQDVEKLVDNLGVETVVMLLALICRDKGLTAKEQQGYFSDKCRKWLTNSARLKRLFRQLEHPKVTPLMPGS